MEYSAIFHDMDKRFCYAIEKDLFVIRVQAARSAWTARISARNLPMRMRLLWADAF